MKNQNMQPTEPIANATEALASQVPISETSPLVTPYNPTQHLIDNGTELVREGLHGFKQAHPESGQKIASGVCFGGALALTWAGICIWRAK